MPIYLKPGDQAPEFELLDQKENSISLAKLQGQKVVLFFYPKDDTPGCTIESCEFRDLAGEFAKKNTLVFGVSADSAESHRSFDEKFSLNFPLLVDHEHKVCEAYGVWGEQEWKGQKFLGISRATFLINEKGLIQNVYEKVVPEGHAEQVLRDLDI